MSPPQLAQSLPAASFDVEPSGPFMTDCLRNAMLRLALTFEQRLPLATLIGEGKSGSGFVISRFLADRESDDVAMARVTNPCTDPIEAMREIIRAIGFQPKDMNLSDLEKIFTMFLSYQRTHQRRTIICIEDAQESGTWMLDKVRRMVELETAGQYGLMVILSGQPDLNRLLEEPPLNAIRGQTRERIFLAPLTEAETREYVQRRVEAGSGRDISQLVDFNAIHLLHELSGGVPDTLRDLCSASFELLDETEQDLITPELVNRANERLHNTLPGDADDSQAESTGEGRVEARLVASLNGKLLQEQTMTRGHVLIGRDVMCNICVNHPTVSRYHALIVNSPRGIKVVDLGSTNGTYINGRKCRQYALKDNDKLSVGSSEILFLAGDDQRTLHFDTERTDHFDAECAAPGH